MTLREDFPWGYQGPGPRERKWWNRIHFRLFRTWPASVVAERLSNTQIRIDHIKRVRRIGREDNAQYDNVRCIPTETSE